MTAVGGFNPAYDDKYKYGQDYDPSQYSQENKEVDYDEFIEGLNGQGNKTTRIHEKEANFFDYGYALSDELKEMIVESFDNPQDEVLQAEIAALYQKYGASVLQRGDFMKMLRNNGYEVTCEYIKTSYISDNKADGRWDTDITNGHIGVYTISDGKGGEIVIADANGNGALEIEEVFMNKILTDVAGEFNPSEKTDFVLNNGGSHSNDSIINQINELEEQAAEKKENGVNVTQDDYNTMVEQYLNMGLGIGTAEKNAVSRLKLGKDNEFSFTGEFPVVEAKPEKVSQKNFNEMVSNYMAEGKSVDEATKLANEELGVKMDFTGEVEEEQAA